MSGVIPQIGMLAAVNSATTTTTGAEYSSQGNPLSAAVAQSSKSTPELVRAGYDLKPTAEALAGHFNQLAQQSGRELNFSVDQESDQLVIKVMDSGTGKVIRQIPSEEMLRLARELHAQELPVLVQDEA
jgi:flagellar protein FlaG